MKVVTAAEMRELDREAIEGLGIPGIVLMERAGLAIVARIRERFGRRRVVILAGRGNNGGDGMVVARTLQNEGWDVKVFLAGRQDALRGDALRQYRIARKCGVSVNPIENFLINRSSIFHARPILVDALLGTGLDKNVSGVLSEAILRINESGVPVISIDIPTGISSDTGQVMGNAVRADCTVTFGLPKRGHLLYPGAEYTGRLFIENIGFPEQLLRSQKIAADLTGREEAAALLPSRPACSHKGTYGHVLVIAGSKGKTGAALMAAHACMRAGAGCVTLGVPESLAEVFQARVTEEMTLSLPDRGDGTLSRNALRPVLEFLHTKADVLAIGPGIGVSGDIEHLVSSLIRKAGVPVVVDADGINAITGGKTLFSGAGGPVILTPHPGEMARLLGKEQRAKGRNEAARARLRDEIEKDRVHTAITFTRATGACLVLKGVPTLTAAPDGQVFFNSTGNPGMASAGSGDVLTGIISGLLGQKITPLNASILGVFIHGLAGDIAASVKGFQGVIATDILEYMPSAFLSLENDA
ncbi:MAG: NAD(P)H-hydrate dehydratase [Nitrospirota bacterium]